MKSSLFYSKILLFGEYGIIKNSKGISIPYDLFKGFLKIGYLNNKIEKKSNGKLNDFYQYLVSSNEINSLFDLEQFKSDIDGGLYFESSIPQGYGIGSSGALVAAVYDSYAIDKVTILENLDSEKILSLKKVFSIMESFFHGKSSGLDPLNSYLSLPILINSKTDIKTTGIPFQNRKGKGGFFIIDSGLSSDTESLVKYFIESMNNEDFKNIFESSFVNVTDKCVDDFLDGNFKNLFTNIKSLSKIVFDNFKPMIPDSFYKVWENGLKSEDYILKLCGSGGGGYILGFTKDLNKAQKQLSEYNFKVVYRY